MKPIFTKKVTPEEQKRIVNALLDLSLEHQHFVLLESELSNCEESSYDLIAGIGAKEIFNLNSKNLFEIDLFLEKTIGQWRFVQINYNFFNSIYSSTNSNKESLFEFDLLSIFTAKTTVVLKNNELRIFGDDDLIKNDLFKENKDLSLEAKETISKIKKSVLFDEYNHQFKKIQKYLSRGDIYEVNYCIPFIIDVKYLNLTHIYKHQKRASPAPFAAFYKSDYNYLVCASPERFIKKLGDKISCQPMKGTAKKSRNESENQKLKNALASSEKERAENVMIVDLTRNDLSKIAKKGSVQVKELFGIYEFPHVYQMISTVEATLKDNTTFLEILKALFPMGSMTGAPKLNAIKIIEEVECFSRELFSGSIGYIDPNGDFDFNVIIRSILYNEKTDTALIAAGGAITVQSNASDEYQECLLKANNNLKLLGIDLSEVNLQG
jgi:para-aminobenzoate synthetase component 1